MSKVIQRNLKTSVDRIEVFTPWNYGNMLKS